jgi:hypothetical protein
MKLGGEALIIGTENNKAWRLYRIASAVGGHTNLLASSD